jgi:hypothetical protein
MLKKIFIFLSFILTFCQCFNINEKQKTNERLKIDIIEGREIRIVTKSIFKAKKECDTWSEGTLVFIEKSEHEYRKFKNTQKVEIPTDDEHIIYAGNNNYLFIVDDSVYHDVKYFGAKGDGIEDDTYSIAKAVLLNVLLSKGKYNVRLNNIIAAPDIIIRGEENAIIRAEGEMTFRNGQSNFIIQIYSNTIVKNIIFEGVGNNHYAIRAPSSKGNTIKNIEILACKAYKCGLLLVEPIEGFTFNRYNASYESWYENGKVKPYHISSNVIVRNCILKGDDKLTPVKNNFRTTASGIALLYVKEATIEHNEILNYRFGIWIYGGASLSEAHDSLSENDILIEKHLVKYNFVSETFSAMWASKARNVNFERNIIYDFHDVSLDFEGCQNSKAVNNTVKIKNRGGIAALNGSQNIIFESNMVEKESSESAIVYVKNGCSNIQFVNNIFTSKLGLAKVKIFRGDTFNGPPNKKILFEGNTLKDIQISIFDKLDESIVLINNKFQSSTNKLNEKNAVIIPKEGKILLRKNSIQSTDGRIERIIEPRFNYD